MAKQTGKISELYKTEDCWAIWLGLLIIFVAMAFFWSGSTIKEIAITPGKWSDLSALWSDLVKNFVPYLIIFLGFGLVFTISMAIMGHDIKEYISGYIIIFLGSLAIFYLASSKMMKDAHLGAPLLALVIGLIIGNVKKMPRWFQTSMRTEYYIKTGIVLLGATLPFTLIISAGPIAFVQATIISVTTWLTIYLAATRIFGLEPRFGAVLGTGGAVCGVSAAIAVGGAVKAKKDHIAITIGIVSIWAIVMILSLVVITKVMIPPPEKLAVTPDTIGTITPGEAGAWVGTSEFADAAGFAVVAEIASEYGESAIHTFTLMKVIGRDIWVGIWAFVLSIVSVIFWEEKEGQKAVRPGVIWERFPKFVLGFFVASIIISIIAASGPKLHVGEAKLKGVLKTHVTKETYNADFSEYKVPVQLADKFAISSERGTITFQGKMSFDELDMLLASTTTKDQKTALKQLYYKSDWFESVLKSKAIAPIKNLRSWCFVFCFLCIGLSTRIKDLLVFGMKPFWAFTIGVMVNLPLGFILSTYVFSEYWKAIR
jgi:uncharacterized membrane protein YadS